MPVNFLHSLNQHTNLAYGYSSKQDGNMSFLKGDAYNVTSNRVAFAEKVGIDAGDFMTIPHNGSNNILVIKQNDQLQKDSQNYYLSGGKIIHNHHKGIYQLPSFEHGIDAVVSNKPDLFPLVILGDCVGLQLVDVKNLSFGVVHAGLSGCVNNIVPHTLQAMQNNFGSKPEDIRAILPPSIRQCHYEVARLALWQDAAVQEKHGKDPRHEIHGHFNLHAVIKDQLHDFGITPKHIHDIELCTACHTDLFNSNFIAGKKGMQAIEGRFVSTIGVKSPQYYT